MSDVSKKICYHYNESRITKQLLLSRAIRHFDKFVILTYHTLVYQSSICILLLTLKNILIETPPPLNVCQYKFTYNALLVTCQHLH